jgi:hypothetical protein
MNPPPTPRRRPAVLNLGDRQRKLDVELFSRAERMGQIVYFKPGNQPTPEEKKLPIILLHSSDLTDDTIFLYFTKEQYDGYIKDGTVILPVAMPPPSDEKMVVLPGQKDPISYEPIIDDMKMATFNGEYNKHRYYQYETVKSLIENRSRTATGEDINPATVKTYTAKIEGKTRVKFEGKPYDLVVISPGKYKLEDDSGNTVKEYDNSTLENAPLDHVGGRRKTRRSKKRRATRRAKGRTRRSRS